jgi:ABC-type spermidine/putrescine transport system permease subunit I
VPYLWLLLFFLVPFLIVLKISFSESQARDAAVRAAAAVGRRAALDVNVNFATTCSC